MTKFTSTFKTAAEALRQFKKDEMHDYIPNDLPRQYRSMAAGSNGGPAWGQIDENGRIVSVRDAYYPNKPDAFFQEVCIGMGWVDPTSEAELQEAVETLNGLAKYPESIEGNRKMEAYSAWGDILHSISLWMDSTTLDIAMERSHDLWLIGALQGDILDPVDVATVSLQELRDDNL